MLYVLMRYDDDITDADDFSRSSQKYEPGKAQRRLQ